ncbi:MAG: tRNA (N(6)-L-threonylcarbamoyladenosine(37)-C(2))-methylthiotransferase MtaB, partial [Lachnospiraceae bacterium]|nr:tRNA (N(6)-L-threonylcarbamoyladenosine(37)-C(2))-methylthiotransferase MtaB [Lachnospiraceae bacterium]
MNKMNRSVALHNLGCKVNAYELGKITETLREKGYTIVPFSESADIYVINTCTVTNIADRKSRQMLHRAKTKNPKALVVALGCFVDTDPEGVKKDDCIDVALGNKEKGRLAEVLATYEDSFFAESDATPRCEASPAPHARTRAFVKIQDGCNLFCSYCIIPFARGRSISRTPEEVTEEVRALAAQGIKEIVLTGIHLSSYDGAAKDGNALQGLIGALNRIDGLERIRLGSLEPRLVTEKTVEAFVSADKLCPHFHLSLQSGSDAVLQRMRRRYTTKEYAAVVAMLRKAYAQPAITTDLITGFPGETGREFEESRAFVEEMQFYETHVFPFSARKGTTAYDMEGQLTQAEKKARADVLIRMGMESAHRYREQFLGKPLRVLWEEAGTVAGKRLLTGYTERYVRVGI